MMSNKSPRYQAQLIDISTKLKFVMRLTGRTHYLTYQEEQREFFKSPEGLCCVLLGNAINILDRKISSLETKNQTIEGSKKNGTNFKKIK